MNFLERLEFFIQEYQLCEKSDRILLTVSGGKDSMLMADLFVRLGYNVIIAHCNFNLRGEASDLDEELVRRYAEAVHVPFYVRHFDTETYASTHRISIQMAARELRYLWFDDLVQELACDRIAIAHHMNDNIETVFLNLSRGTGLLGLQGILPKRGKLIRPLLFLTAAEIEQYVKLNQIVYRDDASNFSTKYARNKIRIDIISKFKEIQPEFEHVFEQNIQNFRDSYQLLQSFVEPIRQDLFQAHQGLIYIQKEKLYPHLKNLPLCYELFAPYSFAKNILQDLIDCWDKESGRIFESSTHTLLLDREELILQPNKIAEKEEIIISIEDKEIKWMNYRFEISVADEISFSNTKEKAYIDFDKLIFPLRIRSWQEGDVFIPLGMNGKKKLSDFFINQKLNIYEKSTVPILVNGNGEIIWIAKWRMDNRYKITENTKKVFTLVCN